MIRLEKEQSGHVEKVKVVKEREEERVRILVASAKTQAAKNIERASAEMVKKKIAQHESGGRGEVEKQ